MSTIRHAAGPALLSILLLSACSAGGAPAATSATTTPIASVASASTSVASAPATSTTAEAKPTAPTMCDWITPEQATAALGKNTPNLSPGRLSAAKNADGSKYTACLLGTLEDGIRLIVFTNASEALAAEEMARLNKSSRCKPMPDLGADAVYCSEKIGFPISHHVDVREGATIKVVSRRTTNMAELDLDLSAQMVTLYKQAHFG